MLLHDFDFDFHDQVAVMVEVRHFRGNSGDGYLKYISNKSIKCFLTPILTANYQFIKSMTVHATAEISKVPDKIFCSTNYQVSTLWANKTHVK